ncbi:keratin-associated protein 5-1 [Hydra vulgaris]|uniref:keratin-associated protein 5-1 n=1 Tax=Hydra vulgaris TaxID=6087 RepID=UPI0002B4787D|nr:keratin-associated protein 5-1 [Hydra vulgaris]
MKFFVCSVFYISYTFLFMMFLHLSLGSPITPCNPVECFVDPCAYHICPNGSQCVSNYCKGCNAECKPCVTTYCKVDPCLNYRCSPGYHCVANYCNGCNAECKKCPTTVCKVCPLFCVKGSRCIIKNNCGKCTYSCSKLINPMYEVKK